MDVELQVAVIGMGHRARIFCEVVGAADGARVVACVDPDAAARTRVDQWVSPQVPLFASLDEMLAATATDDGQGIDAAFVITPDDQHVHAAVRLLEAGVAVYLEKPMATTIDDADRILEAAASTGRTLYVGHNMRLMRLVLQMKEIVDAGTIGEVMAVWCRHFVGNGGDYYFKDWHAERAHTTGLLLQKAAHDIDVIHWLSGGRTRRVVATGNLGVYNRVTDHTPHDGKLMPEWVSELRWPPLEQTGINPATDVEDLSMMLMELDNGVLASYQQCHYTPDYWRNYTVIGTRGRIENIGDDIGAEIRVWTSRTPGFNPHPDQVVPVVEEKAGHAGADHRIIEEFLDHLRGRGPLSSSPVEARDAIAAGWAATWSLRHGSVPVDVEPVAPELAEHFARASAAVVTTNPSEGSVASPSGERG